MESRLSVFTGTANPELARNIGERLGLALGNAQLREFPDGELQVELQQSVRGHDVYLIQSTSPPADRHLTELLLLADACRRSGAARITAVVPYFGYSRQDRRTGRRQALGGRVFADIICAAPFARLVLVDLHAAGVEGFFSLPVELLSAVPLLAERLLSGVDENAIVVSPDLGAVKLADRYAKLLERPLAIVHKTRVSGREVGVRQIIGDVRDRVPIVVDDMLSTGATVEAAIRGLVAAGARPPATVVVSHGLFVKPAEELLAPLPLARILTTDSVSQRASRLPIEVVSLGPLVAEAIRRLHAGQSLEDLHTVVATHAIQSTAGKPAHR
jgi:ribose-phosphate pyrophosphokinase